jgi:plastocyanin
MRKLLTITAAVCVLGAGGYAAAGGLALKNVNIRSTGFSPRTVTVNGGDTVQWKNLDTVAHQVVANNGSFASGALARNATYARRMDTPGTYGYRDALHPSLRGTVRVVGPPPSVSIGVSAPILTWGNGVRLTGAISPAAVGDTVVLYARPYPLQSFIEIGRVQTTTNGVYDFSHRPEILTTYRATWKGKTTAEVQTAIAPQLSLVKIGNWFVTRARAAKSFSGRWVYAQRLNSFGQWVSLRKVTLNRQSAQRFKLELPRGRSLIRVYMTTNQAGAGYIFSASQNITVRRR